MWVFWVHASNVARFEQGYREIAEQAKIPDRSKPKIDIFKLVYDWLCDEKSKWILILDNVDDAGFLLDTQGPNHGQLGGLDNMNSRPLREYLPPSQNGSILITSRSREAALSLVEQSGIIAIDPMNETHALALFETKLGTHSNRKDVVDLAAALEFMPLAIVQAAAYISQRAPRCSVRQYLERFWKSDHKKTSLLNYEGGHLRRDREARNSIITTWQISFDHIRQARPSAADLLSLMSFFDRQGIPEFLIRTRTATGNDLVSLERDNWNNEKDDDEDSTSGPSEGDGFEHDLIVLRNFSFISVKADGSTFEMHRLVQLAMREWLEANGQLEKWKQQYIKNLDKEFPTGNYENWAKCQALFPHAKSALAQRPEREDSLRGWASLLHNAAWYAWSKGNLADAEKMSVKAMNVREKMLGYEHEETLDSMAMVATVYNLGARWNESEALRVQVMETSKRVLGPEHPDTLNSVANLASTYWNQGRWNEAEALQVQVMETSKRVLAPEHRDILHTMAHLASTYTSQGRWNEAEALQVQVMETRKRVLAPEHPDTLRSMANLASTYMNQRRWNEAEALLVQVMETRKKVLGMEHPDTLVGMNNLAHTWKEQGRDVDAVKLLEKCVQLRTQVIGANHPHTLSSSASLTRWQTEKFVD